MGFATSADLKKIPVSGGTVVSLCAATATGGATWGPDDTVVFAATHPKVGLMKVSAAGGTPQSVTILKGKETSHRWPQHLPGGQMVLFSSYESPDFNDGNIEVVDLKSGRRTMVHSGGTYARYAASGHLLFVHRNTLFAAPFDLGRLELAGRPVPVQKEVMTNGVGGAHYDVSGAGTLVYVSGHDASLPPRRLFWATPGGKLTPLSERVRSYYFPALAPNGKRLAVSIFEQGNWDMWVLDLERDSQTRLTVHDHPDFGSVWSPDGRWIVFCSQRDGRAQIYRQLADSSGQAERLLESEYDQAPFSFSPDARYLLFSQEYPGSPSDIWVLALEGKRESEVLVDSKFNEHVPAFSPDGRWFAYESDESGRAEIYARAFRGPGGRWPVSTKGGARPRWSGDGRRLFYWTNHAIMSVAVRTEGNQLQVGTPQAVVETDATSTAWDWDVAPDGKRFLLIRDEPSSASTRPAQVKLTFHWFEELKRLALRK